jgi:hypothetical protein
MSKPLIYVAAASLVAIVAASAAVLPAVGAVNPSPAAAFAGLTTIYVGAGVRNSDAFHMSTLFMCGNVSGATASLRVQVLFEGGSLAGQTTINVAHGATVTVATLNAAAFAENNIIPASTIAQGMVNIESTQSAVFCTAVVVDAQGTPPIFSIPLNLVRVNPHAGTAE